MPRKARILVPNYPHHIVQRGHNRKVVFLANEDYRFYLDNLKEWKIKPGVQVVCLVPGDESRSFDGGARR